MRIKELRDPVLLLDAESANVIGEVRNWKAWPLRVTWETDRRALVQLAMRDAGSGGTTLVSARSLLERELVMVDGFYPDEPRFEIDVAGEPLVIEFR